MSGHSAVRVRGGVPILCVPRSLDVRAAVYIRETRDWPAVQCVQGRAATAYSGGYDGVVGGQGMYYQLPLYTPFLP